MAENLNVIKKMSVAKAALAGEAGRVGISGSQNMEQAYDVKREAINIDIESRLKIVQVCKSVMTPCKAKKTYSPRLG